MKDVLLTSIGSGEALQNYCTGYLRILYLTDECNRYVKRV